MNKKILYLLGIFIILFFVYSWISENVSDSEYQPTVKIPEQRIDSTNPLERINQIVKKVGDYEPTIYDSDTEFDFATEDSEHYEIIINTLPSDIDSCFDAKNSLYQIMKGLYSDELVKDKIVRVQFTAWGYLKASLGYEDAKNLKWDVGPSNYWKVTLQYKDYEDTSGPLSQQTWGVQIDEDCD